MTEIILLSYGESFCNLMNSVSVINYYTDLISYICLLIMQILFLWM